MISRPPTEPRPRITARPFPVAVVVLLVGLTGAGIASGYGISLLVKSRRAWLVSAEQATRQIRTRLQDLMDRHPDYATPPSVEELERLLALPAPRRARAMDKATNLLSVVRQDYRKLAGASPADGFKSFSPNGFRTFYDNLLQPATLPPVTGTPITDLAAADARIVQIAERRGYRPRPLADEAALATAGAYRAQRDALEAFFALQAEARMYGIELGLVSGYRSLSHQRSIFLGRLQEMAQELRHRSVTLEEIAQGEADDVVDGVLKTSSIPGYSKHHTGYAMDWMDVSSGIQFTDFDQTPAHQWLAADNYLNAKRFGFVPSYPYGASEQGPDPETWEYVWVGADLLKETW